MAPNVSVSAYQARRYVIACKTPTISSKIFQIAFGRDGSLFVALPYYKGTQGTVGIVDMPASLEYPTNLRVGEKFPVTSHSVKYSHHPGGRAHFSLTGKVKTIIAKDAVPLHKAEGHLFSVMAYNLHTFAPLYDHEKGTAKRGIVPFGLSTDEPAQVKFVGHLYSDKEVARRFSFPSPDQIWVIADSLDGKKKIGILLVTPITHLGKAYFLFLTMEEVPGVPYKPEGMINIIGGFDPPEVARDHSSDTSFLFGIYPTSGNFEELVRKKGTIDLQSDNRGGFNLSTKARA